MTRGYSPESIAYYSAELRWRRRLKQENDSRIAELEAIVRPMSDLREEMRARARG